jgi:hypothetical protein
MYLGGWGGCRLAAEMRCRAGDTVRVKLAPSAHTRWCTGTFHGQVWSEVFPRCPTGKACPALAVPPLMVGKFSFRVTPG